MITFIASFLDEDSNGDHINSTTDTRTHAMHTKNKLYRYNCGDDDDNDDDGGGGGGRECALCTK